ncbi:hypothetical protein F5144DRAFT_621224 [Chaetomium tenue]|uniref:Uncharacterized protein n=1 Tax=Chaetomium tenue TaxID=1854479 RepID=A0ACB7PBC6_9PEZI|nr:hypothetical protein F5144DRAFT_621224 [Chaetomium globosum]
MARRRPSLRLVVGNIGPWSGRCLRDGVRGSPGCAFDVRIPSVVSADELSLQANVDYVLLERRGEVAPQVGASIGMFPNGARILDQLGVWKGVEKRAASQIAAPSFFMQGRDTGWVGVSGGTCWSPSDGVFSKTRTKMWQFAEADHPELVKQDRNCLIAEYNCLFGIVKGLDCPRFPAGDVHTTYNEDRCALSISVEGGKAYYFAQERLPQTHRLGDIPRYTDADTKAFVERHRDFIILPGEGGLTLSDFWEKTDTARLVAVEEAKFKLWHWGRIVCVGDSIHKSTPNLGVGGNSAIESAAALANGIKLLADKWNATGRRPTHQEIETMLAVYQKQRELRAGAVVDASGFLARTQNMHGSLTNLFVRFLLPHLSEFVPELMGNAIIGATKIDYLPLPMASLTGTKPFNPSQGDGHRESKLKRMVYALPLLALTFIAAWVMNAQPALEWATGLLDSGVIRLASGDVPILRSFYQVPALDDLVALYNTFFFPTLYDSDPVSRRQLISFLTDGAILLTIWIFESARRANMMTPLQFPIFFITLGQLLGIGLAAPLYTFLHYTLSPIENFSARDQRLTRTRTSYAALPAILLTYLLPFYAMLCWPDLAARQALLYVWQLYPVWLALAVWGLGRGLWKDEMETDKVYRTQRDLPVMRWYVGGLGVLAVGVWWWSAWEFGLGEVFVPGGLPRGMGDLEGFAGQFLRWDQVFGMGSLLVWLAYLFGDLRAAGMLREGWFRVVGLGVVSVLVFGPGATIGMGWLFREHILATRRHKDALTPESVGRLHGASAMAAQDPDTLICFQAGPFRKVNTISASKFHSLNPPPDFQVNQGGFVECPELHGELWRMFVSWVHTRDYEIPPPDVFTIPWDVESTYTHFKRMPQPLHTIVADYSQPFGRFCLTCLGELVEFTQNKPPCSSCELQFPGSWWRCGDWDCRAIDEFVYCPQCTANLEGPRVRSFGKRARKVKGFVRFFLHLQKPEQPAYSILPSLTTDPNQPALCHSRRLTLQFQLYDFAQKHKLTELQDLVLHKVWYTLMDLQPHPHTTAEMVKSLLGPLTKLGSDDPMWSLLTTYWACVREDMIKFEHWALLTIQGPQLFTECLDYAEDRLEEY